jgi:adenylylsulfate kinase-like enzyme
MIVVFYGKRNSGKTTICREFYGWIKQNLPVRCHYLDSDKLRFVYGMKGFSQETERALIAKSMEIARYEESLNDVVLVSVSFAYEDQRILFNEKKGILWVYLTHDEEKRISNKKEYADYEEPSDPEAIDTTNQSVESVLQEVIGKYRNFCLSNGYK